MYIDIYTCYIYITNNRLLLLKRLVSQMLSRVQKEEHIFLTILQRMKLPLIMGIYHSCSHHKQDPWLPGSPRLHAIL